MKKPIVGFSGMTHLGLNSAAAAAERGFEIVCYDSDPEVVARIQDAELPVSEPDLTEYLSRNSGHVKFTAEAGDLSQCDVVYIAADVPTDDQGASDLSGIRALIDTVAGNLGPSAVLVILCQVPPGFTRDLPVPAERLFYQVETLIFGRAMERAMYPERTIIGCADPSRPLPEAYGEVLAAFECPILPMRYESAELAKISINFCLVASISVANMLAELCARIGADWMEIAPALQLDERIGPHAYLTPGLGISGGNLERDLTTVLRLAEAHGTDSGVVDAWLSSSRHCKGWAMRILRDEVLPNTPDPAIAVLGLAYKENTHSTKNSPAFALLEATTDYRVSVYDPVVPSSAAPHGIGADSVTAAVAGADVLAIMTPWAEFGSLDVPTLAREMNGHNVLDPYRVLDGDVVAAAGLDYFTLGAPMLRASTRK